MNTSMLTSYRRVFWSLAALLISLSRGSFLLKGKYFLIEWARLLAKFRIYLFLGDANLIFFKFTQTNNDWLNVFFLFSTKSAFSKFYNFVIIYFRITETNNAQLILYFSIVCTIIFLFFEHWHSSYLYINYHCLKYYLETLCYFYP